MSNSATAAIVVICSALMIAAVGYYAFAVRVCLQQVGAL